MRLEFETCDVFTEAHAFGLEDSRRVLERARALGLGLRLHVDQLTPLGGAELAAELGAASADHLEFVSERVVLFKTQTPLGADRDNQLYSLDLDTGKTTLLATAARDQRARLVRVAEPARHAGGLGEGEVARRSPERET